MRSWELLIFVCIITLGSASIKTLASSCFCDVSTSCDVYCCCDTDCSSTLIYNWNNYTLCASEGYPIPLCSYYYNEPMHSHDLYQGLRLIYTIVKRLFCVSKINFLNSSSGFVSTTTDSQITVPTTIASAISSSVLNLANITNYSNLPLKNSMGTCSQYALKDMNNIQDDACRVYASSSSAVSSNNYLSLSTFVSNNNLAAGSLVVYLLTNPSTPMQNSNLASSAAVATSCTGTTCLLIKQIKLFFIKTATSVTIDYSSSYIVMGNTVISDPTYVYVKYSYQFISQTANYPYSSNQGYSKNSPLQLVKSITNGSTTNYYKIFNPVNLAFVNIDGSCRSASSDSDQSNLISFKFGVNSIYSCSGSSSLAYTNLKQAFDSVGALGSASTNLGDFVSIDYTAIISNQNIQLLFYYISIGTQSNPQYQITKAVLNALSVSSNNQFSLFVEYMPLSNSVILNLPSPPVINAYLPDDFLYPFYVA